MHKRRVYQNKDPKCFFLSDQMPSQKIKVIQLLPVTQDIALNLAGINPGDKVLHVTRNQKSRIIDNLRTNTDMALLNESSSLPEQKKKKSAFHRLVITAIHHLQP